MSISFGQLKRNSSLLKNILSKSPNLETSNQTMDAVLNSSTILYKDIDDFKNNFPVNGEMDKKIKIILARLKNG